MKSRKELLSSTTRSPEKRLPDDKAEVSPSEDHKENDETTDPSEGESDWIWGALAIGKRISRTPSQVHYLFETGALGNAVWKFGHKSLVGSRRRLQSPGSLKGTAK